MPRKVSPARAGIVDEPTWNRLKQLQETDWDKFIEEAVVECYDNYSLFNFLFLDFGPEHAPTPHFDPVWDAMDTYDKVLIELPRSHTKSSALMGRILHDICYHHLEMPGYEDYSVLLVQESGKEARDTVQEIKDQLASGGPAGMLFEAFCNDRTFEENAKRWAQDSIWLRTGAVTKDPTLKGVGIEGGSTGKHPKLLLFDDVATEDNSNSKYMRDKLWRNWQKTFRDLLDVGSQFVSLYTPKYSDDLNARLKDTGHYKVIKHQALNRVPTEADADFIRDDDGTVVGVEVTDKGKELEALWPCPLGTGNCPMTEEHFREYGAHRPVKDLLLRWHEDRMSFMENQMLDLGARENALVESDSMRFFVGEKQRHLVGTEAQYNQTTIEPFPDRKDVICSVHAWDHAMGKGKAETAHARLYRTKRNDVYIIVRSGDWSPVEVLKQMETQYRTDPICKPYKVATEAINFQELFGDFADELATDLTFVQRTEPVKSNKNKAQALRDSGLLSLMDKGKVFFEYSDEDTITQFLNFTENPKGKVDRVDAVRIGYEVLKHTKGREGSVKTIGTGRRGAGGRKGSRRAKHGKIR